MLLWLVAKPGEEPRTPDESRSCVNQEYPGPVDLREKLSRHEGTERTADRHARLKHTCRERPATEWNPDGQRACRRGEQPGLGDAHEDARQKQDDESGCGIDPQRAGAHGDGYRAEQAEKSQGASRAPTIDQEPGRDLKQGIGPEENARRPTHLPERESEVAADRALDDAQASAMDVRQPCG